VSWPALGESSKASPKLSPPDSIKTGGDDGSSPSGSAPPVRLLSFYFILFYLVCCFSMSI